jgi:tetratricopeptide (TPR) repeat protein
MYRRTFTPLLLLLCLLLSPVPAPAQDAGLASAAAGKSEAEKWREDLLFMAAEMEARHKNLFHTLSREQFEGAVRKLHERIPALARHQIIVELARLAASVGDGHTNLAPTRDPKIGFRSFPVKLYLFKDGLFVRAAERGHAELLGARVVNVGGATPDEALRRVRDMIGHDNEMGVRFSAPFLLTMPEVLHALGLAEGTEGGSFTFVKDGRERTLTLKPSGPTDMMPPDTDLSWLPKEGWVDLRDAAAAPTPLWLRDPRDKFWFEYLPEAKVVYVQLNEVGNKEKESLANFSERLFSFVEANPVEKLVLDLRLNRGGNGELLRPLEIGLIKSKLNQPGKLFAVIGRGTWSASQFLLNRMEKYTNVRFVGEPSGSKGNVYGDSRRITLPHSGLTVRASVYYWQDWAPWDTRLWTAPHVTAELSSEDYRTNSDPALKAVIGYVPRKTLEQVLNEALAEGGHELALKRFREFRADPANRYADTEEALLRAGQRLLDEKKPEQALALFRLDAEENPHSFRAYYAAGYAYHLGGDKAQAVRHLEKALAMNPKSYEVAVLLRQVRRQ